MKCYLKNTTREAKNCTVHIPKTCLASSTTTCYWQSDTTLLILMRRYSFACKYKIISA